MHSSVVAVRTFAASFVEVRQSGVFADYEQALAEPLAAAGGPFPSAGRGPAASMNSFRSRAKSGFPSTGAAT